MPHFYEVFFQNFPHVLNVSLPCSWKKTYLHLVRSRLTPMKLPLPEEVRKLVQTPGVDDIQESTRKLAQTPASLLASIQETRLTPHRVPHSPQIPPFQRPPRAFQHRQRRRRRLPPRHHHVRRHLFFFVLSHPAAPPRRRRYVHGRREGDYRPSPGATYRLRNIVYREGRRRRKLEEARLP